MNAGANLHDMWFYRDSKNTGLQGGAFMHNWTNDDRVMIACCNDGTRPVIFKLECIDIPEDASDEAYLRDHDFRSKAEYAYTG